MHTHRLLTLNPAIYGPKFLIPFLHDQAHFSAPQAGFRIRFLAKFGSRAFKNSNEDRLLQFYWINPDSVRIIPGFGDSCGFSGSSTSMERLTPKVWKQIRSLLKLSKTLIKNIFKNLSSFEAQSAGSGQKPDPKASLQIYGTNNLSTINHYRMMFVNAKNTLKQGQTVNGSKAIDKETRNIDIVRQKI